jgi:hypothetical protein
MPALICFDPLMVAFNAVCADVNEPLVDATEHICGLESTLFASAMNA